VRRFCGEFNTDANAGLAEVENKDPDIPDDAECKGDYVGDNVADMRSTEDDHGGKKKQDNDGSCIYCRVICPFDAFLWRRIVIVVEGAEETFIS
jgi:hypothetical protein